MLGGYPPLSVMKSAIAVYKGVWVGYKFTGLQGYQTTHVCIMMNWKMVLGMKFEELPDSPVRLA